MHDSIRQTVVHYGIAGFNQVNSGTKPTMFNRDVPTDVSIASIYASLREMGRNEKALILLAQMRREKLRKDLPQIFQSCTFNRSVTSPYKQMTPRYLNFRVI